MFKLMSFIAAAALAIVAQPAPAQAALGPDAASCRSGSNRPAILVRVSGFKNKVGRLRVQLYGGNPADFLTKGKKLRRIDVPVNGAAVMPICISVPRAGNYAVAVRHDADANGKSGWSDGGGFSRNPKISLFDLKPSLGEVIIPVGNGVKPVDVILNYRHGLSIGPVRS